MTIASLWLYISQFIIFVSTKFNVCNNYRESSDPNDEFCNIQNGSSDEEKDDNGILSQINF